MLFIKIKVFVLNWFQWHQKLQHLFIGAPIIDENAKKCSVPFSIFVSQKTCINNTSCDNITIILKLGVPYEHRIDVKRPLYSINKVPIQNIDPKKLIRCFVNTDQAP
jgi:hypothetical protein